MMARIVSDKSVMDGPFSTAILQAWGADPGTVFEGIARNCFLIEFKNVEDMTKAMSGGPWTYRGDLVATKKVNSHLDLHPKFIDRVSVWVQFHHVPINSLTAQGRVLLGKSLGIPQSAPMEGYVNGRRFIKTKVSIPISKPLIDRLELGHPSLGDLKILCSYEKVSRACLFCGLLGHEIHTCPDHQRLTFLMQQPNRVTPISPEEILAPKFKPWLINPILIPKESGLQEPTNLQSPKRAFPIPGPKENGSGAESSSFADLRLVTLNDSDDADVPFSAKRSRLAGNNPPASQI